MNNAPKTATLLVDLLAKQHKTRSPHLFRRGTFTLVWRAKVGSTPFPNLETIVSAAEPCGRFDCDRKEMLTGFSTTDSHRKMKRRKPRQNTLATSAI
ncbi:MAG: hypothetical protein HC839_01100 [Leptolyngbyaceae cyanobacterium RM2_2_21]|nr:hypothetical protein [Leptolyngbyaceae cyanobacterium RM2_2_21]